MPHLSLYELNSLVRDVIEDTLTGHYWVEAELSEANERRGHLYLDLIQKAETSATPVARASAKCWANTWLTLRQEFERVTQQRLHAGMKVLLEVYPQFHPAYGFSWIVTDIDPTYTLGDMARRRQEIIEALKAEGVFDMQRELQIPLFCKNVAVISSETAAGYGDFCRQLEDNGYGFHFSVTLFPAVMQGEKVEKTVIHALSEIYRRMDDYDCVVIIRGGGATTDMSGFDTLTLAEEVANFPLPIITGIGHERDESVIDMVAHTRVKTPTAAAAFLIDNLARTSAIIDNAAERIVASVRQRLERENMRMTGLATRIPMLFSLVKTRETARLSGLSQRMASTSVTYIQRQRHQIDILERRIPTAVGSMTDRERHRIEMLGQRCSALDPQIILRRGYSMTMSEGHIVTDPDKIPDGAILETRLAGGTMTSIKTGQKQSKA
ncbi:MAG: exodeoxyribonuclease VII large subunit [Prevotella sp.]